MAYRILAINPGATSTKIAVYEDHKSILSKSIAHDSQRIDGFETVEEQANYRKHIIQGVLDDAKFDMNTLHIIMCRGALITAPKLTTGGYEVNDALYEALGDERITQRHASQLGGLIGKQFADKLGIKAYIYDAVTAGDLMPVAEITGFADVVRRSMCHVLNARAMALKYAKRIDVPLENLRLIVAHLGSGCTVAVFKDGKIVESAADDDGPFSPERAGGLPSLQLIDVCFSGKYTKTEMQKMVRGKGGLYAHLGTSDCQEIERRIEKGDERAKLIFQAQAYQIEKAIGLNSVALKGHVDAIILTGGVAFSRMMTDMIREYVRFIAPVIVMPGENELESLALGGLRILRGEEGTKEYHWPQEFEHQK